jgi:hypothetical protein
VQGWHYASWAGGNGLAPAIDGAGDPTWTGELGNCGKLIASRSDASHQATVSLTATPRPTGRSPTNSATVTVSGGPGHLERSA